MRKPSYLNLTFDVVHILGARNSAIYDLHHRRVFSLDKDATDIIKRLLLGEPLEDILNARPDFIDVLDFIVKNSLAQVEYSHQNHNEHLNSECSEPSFKIAWVELGTSCNHKCVHCYNYSGPGNPSLPAFKLEPLKKAIQDLSYIGTETIKFIGGEPLAYKSELRALILYARTFNFERVAIHTNGTLISKEWIDFFNAHSVEADVTVYGHTEGLHEAVTKIHGSFANTIKGLDLIRDGGCPGSINLIVTPHNEESLPECRRFFQVNYPQLPFAYDYIRPAGRGVKLYEQLQFTYLNRYHEHQAYFTGISRKEYLERRRYNPCLKDKITISSSGEIFPCIMTRESAGNVDSQSLASIVASASFKLFRELTLDEVETCRDCEYRFACTDCRPISMGLGLGRYGKPPECKYNPYTGKLEESFIQLKRR